MYKFKDLTNELGFTYLDRFYEKLAYLIVRGGWPGNIDVDVNECGEIANGYMENVLKMDLRKLDKDADYNEQKAKLILKSLARNESTTVSNQSILNDIIENDTESISKNTLVKYLNALNRMFLFKPRTILSEY